MKNRLRIWTLVWLFWNRVACYNRDLKSRNCWNRDLKSRNYPPVVFSISNIVRTRKNLFFNKSSKSRKYPLKMVEIEKLSVVKPKLFLIWLWNREIIVEIEKLRRNREIRVYCPRQVCLKSRNYPSVDFSISNLDFSNFSISKSRFQQYLDFKISISRVKMAIQQTS